MYKSKKSAAYLPPARDSADLSLNRLLMGPATFGAGEWRTGDLTAETMGPIVTGGWGRDAVTGIFPEATPGESLWGSGDPICLDRWR